MSDATEYGDLPISYGAKPCAFAAAAVRNSPADMTHPVNSFIAQQLLSHAHAPGVFSLRPGADLVADSGGPWAESRRICPKPGRRDRAPAATDASCTRRVLH